MELRDLYALYLQHPSIQTDTRNLNPGDLFFALKGPNFNGNSFATKALELGAAYVLADEEIAGNDPRIMQVEDVLQTLQALAKMHRNHFDIPFIAITGSNGKTTTKELIHEVLSKKYITYTTKGNLNNHIGVPLTILRIKADAQMAVIEMGANHLQEIAGYCEYAQPNYGLITNIGKAHIEGFGSAENVKKGKGELFDYLREEGGTVFINTADKAVTALAAGMDKTVPYGPASATFSAQVVKNDPLLEVKFEDSGLVIATQLVGLYNVPNIEAACCIGHYFGVPDNDIKAAIENYKPSNSRSQLVQQGSNTIVLDAYNANPGSMKAAIENFASLPGEKKVLLLGDMKELGDDTQAEHAALVELLDRYTWQGVALVGDYFAAVKSRYTHLPDSEAARRWLQQQNLEHAQILIKGSRSMQMEKVL